MKIDFAGEYRSKTDVELSLIEADLANLVPEAKLALTSEMSTRGLSCAAHSIKEKDEGIDEPYSFAEGDVVKVNSRQLSFPNLCPRCPVQSPGNAFVRIPSGSDLWSVRFPIVALWRYAFSRYKVPFCEKCARSVRLRRWLMRSGIALIIAANVIVSEKFGIKGLASFCLLAASLGAGWGIWKVLKIDNYLPSAGIEIISKPRDTFVRLRIGNEHYRESFLSQNRIKATLSH